MSADILELARLAARRAGDYLNVPRGASQEERVKESSHSIVTPHDLEAERLIVETIKAGSNAPVLSEETEADETLSAPPFWVIDPIDGTSYYARGLGSYSISIAFLDHGGASVGVVFCPASDEMFHAERGAGSFLNGRQIRVSDVVDPAKAIFNFGHRFIRETTNARGRMDLIASVRSIRGGGSCARELAYLAAGRIDGVVTRLQSLWDYAAGRLLVEEAGGRLSDFHGEAPLLHYSGSKNQDIVGTNGFLHQWVLERLVQA